MKLAKKRIERFVELIGKTPVDIVFVTNKEIDMKTII